mmetsp:Transcript_42270/g.83631  ORF Transcript_42270/g.83631 Transcript_42270/m.83631 type:complete len:86 (-) Transcript_42270:1615-1872(-)
MHLKGTQRDVRELWSEKLLPQIKLQSILATFGRKSAELAVAPRPNVERKQRQKIGKQSSPGNFGLTDILSESPASQHLGGIWQEV